MWCTKCGTELSNEIKFCFNCGNKINDLNENYSINISKQNQAETIKNGQVYSDVDMNSRYGNQNTNTNYNMGQSLNANNSVTDYGVNSDRYANNTNYSVNSNQYDNTNYDTNTNQYSSNTNYNTSTNQYNSNTNYDINSNQYNNSSNYDTGMQNKSKNLDKYYAQIELIDIIKSELLLERFEKTGNFYVNDFSGKSAIKFIHAIRHYSTQTVESEVPCLLYDDTAFGSAKNGFILTNKAIHWRNFLEESRKINFRDIIEISSKKGEITINGEKINITLAAKYHFEIERFIMKIINLCDK